MPIYDEAEYNEAFTAAAKDPQRPLFHAAPQAFTMGDPNGLIQINGVYHLFYQHVPTFKGEAHCHWAHMRSRDLLHWEHLPIALAPEGYAHVCSGSAVNNNGEIIAIYTKAEPQQQDIAIAQDPDLIKWKRYEGNPVVAGPPAGVETVGFRDPYVWRDGSVWMMAVGSGVVGKGGAFYLFQSPDMRNWSSAGMLCSSETPDLGHMWECPSLFVVGGMHVLAFNALPLPVDSATMRSVYQTGVYKNKVFTPERTDLLDLCGEIWAPQVFRDEKGRCILFAMAWESRDGRPSGWTGCQTFPREVYMDAQGRVAFRPIEELAKLRDSGRHWGAMTANAAFTPLEGCDDTSDAFEVRATFTPGADGVFLAKRFGIVLRRSPGGEEQTVVYYDPTAQRIGVDRTLSSLDKSAGTWERPDRGGFTLAQDEPLELQIIVDRSVLDIFVNNRAAGTIRIYPTRTDSTGLGLFAMEGSIVVRDADFWRLKTAK